MNIIVELPHAWTKIVIHGNLYITLILTCYFILLNRHETIENKHRSLMLQRTAVRRGIVTRGTDWHYVVIVANCSCMHSRVNITREKRSPVHGVNSVACKNFSSKCEVFCQQNPFRVSSAKCRPFCLSLTVNVDMWSAARSQLNLQHYVS